MFLFGEILGAFSTQISAREIDDEIDDEIEDVIDDDEIEDVIDDDEVDRFFSRYIGFTVNIAELLFTPERDFLLKNNEEKVMAGDLKGKTVVVYMAPLYKDCIIPSDNLDMSLAYNELLPLGGVEFVLVPYHLDELTNYYDKTYNIDVEAEAEAGGVFNNLFSALPFPAVPLSEVKSCGDRLVEALNGRNHLLFWAVIDPTGTVVMTRDLSPCLFKLYGGAELHPLSAERLIALDDEHCSGEFAGNRLVSREKLIFKWDQLLASPTRDFLLSSNGHQVPISSLFDGKVIGLYFCDNAPHPPRMTQIKKVYEEAKLRGYGFEIVQINFHHHFFNSTVSKAQYMSVQLCKEDVSWLTLPFKDPSCKKLQRIFRCQVGDVWHGDCLVILDPRSANELPYDFSGAEIMCSYGIEGYPFTRESLYKLEMGKQKKELKLHLLFPPGQRNFTRPAGQGSADYSQLPGKRVLVLVGQQCESSAFLSELKSKYLQQIDKDDRFEVVFVSTDCEESSFNKCIQGMPWLVHPFSEDFGKRCLSKIFRCCWGLGAAAFGMDGELIAKLGSLFCYLDKMDAEFPFFVSPDLATQIRTDVEYVCELDKMCPSNNSSIANL